MTNSLLPVIVVAGITFVGVCSPTLAIGQPIFPGNISVFGDASGSVCTIQDDTPATFTLYVLHTNMSGTFVSNLRVLEGSGFDATYVSEVVPFIHIGDLRTGLSIAYGGCTAGPLLLGSLVFAGQGTSQSCSTVDTTGNPDWPGIPTSYPITETCNGDVLPAPSVGPLYVNAGVGCQPRCTVATESSTWGKVKSLYRP